MTESANPPTEMTSLHLLKKMGRQLRYIIWQSDLLFIKFILAVSSIIMGLRFFTDTDADKRYVYALALRLASEEYWAGGFLIAGILSLFLLLNRQRKLNHVLPIRAVMCFLWTMLALLLYMSGAVGSAMVPLIMLSLASWLVLARTSERN